MSQQIEYERFAPEAVKSLQDLERYIEHSSLDAKLIELVKDRVAQINGCPACLDMHANALMELGESTQRLNTLSAWRRTDFFSERERAALSWAEVLTRVSETRPGERDEAFEMARGKFNERELVDLTMVVIAINSWNRLHIAFGVAPSISKEECEIKSAS
jgi:AhpD family alkylhydroperoxidase